MDWLKSTSFVSFVISSLSVQYCCGTASANEIVVLVVALVAVAVRTLQKVSIDTLFQIFHSSDDNPFSLLLVSEVYIILSCQKLNCDFRQKHDSVFFAVELCFFFIGRWHNEKQFDVLVLNNGSCILQQEIVEVFDQTALRRSAFLYSFEILFETGHIHLAKAEERLYIHLAPELHL